MSKTTTSLTLGPMDAGRCVTAEEFAEAEFEEPFTYERVKGRLAVMPPAGAKHRLVSWPFRRELGKYWGLNPGVIQDVDFEGWVATSPDDDRIPDICVYLVGSATDESPPQLVPDPVFEFVSESRRDQERDYIAKREEYHAVGVREYVIVDRFKQSVLVLTWQKKDFAEKTVPATDTYTTPRLPGLSVSLEEVFGATSW